MLNPVFFQFIICRYSHGVPLFYIYIVKNSWTFSLSRNNHGVSDGAWFCHQNRENFYFLLFVKRFIWFLTNGKNCRNENMISQFLHENCNTKDSNMNVIIIIIITYDPSKSNMYFDINTLHFEHNHIYQLQKCTSPCSGFFSFSPLPCSLKQIQIIVQLNSAEMQFHLIFDSITIARAHKLFAFYPRSTVIFFTSWCEWEKKIIRLSPNR